MMAEYREKGGVNEGDSDRNARIARRTVLKLGAMAAVAAGAGAAGLRLAGDGRSLAASAPEDEILIGGNFRVDIPGSPEASKNVATVEIDAIEVESLDTGPDANGEYRTYAPGDAHFGEARFTFRVPRNQPSEMQQWIEDAARGQNIRKNISVIIMKKDQSPARTFNLVDCFPVRWDPGDYSPSSNLATESLTCRVTRVEMGY
jgi:phage tail-like protein